MYNRYLSGGSKEFDFDASKSASNLDKHGIDFDSAERLWDDVTVEFKANVKSENRTKAVGRIDGKHWAAIYTVRGKKTRIISVRPATPKERSAYDRHIND